MSPPRFLSMARRLVGTLLVLAGCGTALADGPRTVVELFTSEGCASCPAADALLAGLADDPTTLALSYHVDYWDYLGWKDTLATPENSQRQLAYAEARGDRAVYTPQLVVNGTVPVVGGDAEAVRGAIRAATEPLPVPVAIERGPEAITIRIGAAPPDLADHAATIWIAVVESRHAVTPERGENAGRPIVYRNVVRQMQPIGMWKGLPMTIDLPITDYGKAGCTVLLQVDRDGRPGPILGAARLLHGHQS